MAIPSDELELWTGDEGITSRPGCCAQISLVWQARHKVTGDVISEGTVTRTVATFGQMPSVDAALQDEASGQYAGAVAWHDPQTALDGASAFDADLILDGWMVDGDEMSHPICGTIAATPVGIVARVNGIQAARLGPTQWAWADSTTPGELRVRCVSVAGADDYNVYSGETLLGTVPSAGWNALAVPAGFYQVRIAPVDGGVVGILSFPIAVQVS